MPVANRRLRTGAVTWALICAAIVGLTGAACADGPEHANDHAIVLADIFESPPILPRNPVEADQTFDRRASKILKYAACRPDEGPNSVYKGVFNSNFPDNLQAWGRDALAKLAYTGDCANMTASARYQAVDAALFHISIPGDLHLGTTVDPTTYVGITVERRGELDTGLKELIPIAYLYKDRIPISYTHVLEILGHAVANNLLIIGSPPTFDLDIAGIGSAIIPETENHTLLELSEQYLVNQLLNREFANACNHQLSPCVLPPGSKTIWDNSQVHDYLMRVLRGILTSDFFEYNSKPYQHYALYAMENLADFADDADIATAAKMVLDFDGAKFVISSSLLRRSSPYRRRGSFDGDLFTGTDSDDQLCRFYLYSGQLQAIYNGGGYSADSGCISASREAMSAYRMPDTILGMAISKSISYFQTFSGGTSYYGSMFGSDANGGLPVPGSVEVYDNEGSFLIAAGGIPEPNGLPAKLNGALISMGLFLVDTSPAGFAVKLPQPYSYSDEDVGISLPTLLIPNDPPDNPSGVNAIQPVVDRTQLVRIAGIGHRDANLCVAPGFACGKNPVMPTSLRSYQVDGPWQFAIVSSAPVDTYTAMYTEPAYLVSKQIIQSHPNCEQTMQWPFQIGLFEAEPANKFASFAAFQTMVKNNNPSGTVFIEQDGYTPTVPNLHVVQNGFCLPEGGSAQGQPGPSGGTFLVTGWKGHYTKTDGTALDFIIPILDLDTPRVVNGATVNPHPLPVSDYAVQSSNSRLPSEDPATWNLGDGPIQADRAGTITITDPQTGNSCLLNITDIHNPRRLCSAISLQNNKSSGFMIQSTPVGLSTPEGNFEMVVAQGGNMVHYWRDNNSQNFPWHQGDYLLKESPQMSESTAATTVNGTGLLQSNQGNLEVVAWLHRKPNKAGVFGGGGTAETDYLASFYRDATTQKWYGPIDIMVDGQPVESVTGTPAFIQSLPSAVGMFSSGKGNFEMVIPEGGSMVHYWRDNNSQNFPWHQGDYLLKESPQMSESTAATTVNGAGLLQSRQGNLEVVAWLHRKPNKAGVFGGGGTAETDYLASFYRDATTQKWYGPIEIMVDGKPVEGVTGAPAFIQSTSGKQGNFEMVVPEGGSLVHYWRDNDTPGLPWHQGDYLVKEPDPSEALAATTVRGAVLLQSHQGNLEVVAWLHRKPNKAGVFGGGGTAETDYLASFYRDATTQKWYGPIEIMVDGKPIENVSGPQ